MRQGCLSKKAVFSLVLVSCLCTAGFAFAQEGEKVIRKITRNVQGEVGSIDKRTIALIYNRNAAKNQEDEVVLFLDKDVQLVGIKALDEIKTGDTVRVQYEELTTLLKNGREETRSRAKAINFIKAGEVAKPVLREVK
jgi:hypothetical protein